MAMENDRIVTLVLQHCSKRRAVLQEIEYSNFVLFLIHYFSLLEGIKYPRFNPVTYKDFCQSKTLMIELTATESVYRIGAISITEDMELDKLYLRGPVKSMNAFCRLLSQNNTLGALKPIALKQLMLSDALPDEALLSLPPTELITDFQQVPQFSLMVNETISLDCVTQHLLAVSCQCAELDRFKCLEYFDKKMKDQQTLCGEVRLLLQDYLQTLQHEQHCIALKEQQLARKQALPRWCFWTNQEIELKRLAKLRKIKLQKQTILQAANDDVRQLTVVLNVLSADARFFAHYYLSGLNFLGKYGITRAAQCYRKLEKLGRQHQNFSGRIFDDACRGSWNQQFLAIEQEWVDLVKDQMEALFKRQLNKMSADLSRQPGYVYLKPFNKKVEALEKQKAEFISVQQREIHRQLLVLRESWYREIKREMTAVNGKNLMPTFIDWCSELKLQIQNFEKIRQQDGFAAFETLQDFGAVGKKHYQRDQIRQCLFNCKAAVVEVSRQVQLAFSS